MLQPGADPPILLVSLRYRRDLAAVIQSSGREVAVPHLAEEAPALLVDSGARLVVLDIRGALGPGLERLGSLSDIARQQEAAVIVLLSRRDTAALDQIYALGASHFLVSPFSNTELLQLLRFAARSGARPREGHGADAVSTPAGWRWRIGSREVLLLGSADTMLGLEAPTERIGVDEIRARMPDEIARHVRRKLQDLVDERRPGTLLVPGVSGGEDRLLVHRVVPEFDRGGRLTALSATIEGLERPTEVGQLAPNLDPATGLANSRFARDWVEGALRGRTMFDPPCIVILLAISRFDQINATYGRSTADTLVQSVGRRLRRQWSEFDFAAGRMLLARLSGAEFAIALSGPVALKDAVFLGQRLSGAFERPFIVGGRAIHLACRIGIAVGEGQGDTAEALFRRASAALAQAKTQEPNSIQVFMAEGDEQMVRMASLETDLRQALDADGLDLLFQPQVDIVSNRVIGVEALTRWRHPMLGQLSAETLLDVAENAEVMTRLGEQILDKALVEASRWRGPLATVRLSVNVNAADMRGDDFVGRVARALEASGFPSDRLTLEVTEGGLMQDLEHASELLSRLREGGIKVAIDDFGTGYSSLAYLKSLPLDYLKIDKKLVTDIGGSARDRVVLRGVVDMARSLGMCVVAEGVESDEQLDLLVREGCNWYQGFLCAPPLASGDLERFVGDWNGRVFAAA